MHTPVRLARTAGLFYLIVAILGGFAQIVRERVYVPNNPTATTDNVVASAQLVRLGFVADLVQATAMLVVVLTLYQLLKHVDAPLARAMLTFVVVSTAITCLNMVFQLGALLVATDPTYAAAFTGSSADSAVLLLLDLQHAGYLIAQIFFGLWLLPLGVLTLRSGMFPRALGVLLVAATPAYLLEVAMEFFAVDLASTVSAIVVMPVVILAEVSMLVYLLAKGVRTTASDVAPGVARRPTDDLLPPQYRRGR